MYLKIFYIVQETSHTSEYLKILLGISKNSKILIDIPLASRYFQTLKDISIYFKIFYTVQDTSHNSEYFKILQDISGYFRIFLSVLRFIKVLQDI